MTRLTDAGEQRGEGIGGEGIGFISALLLLFIALKLTGNIDWSWWWVLSPAWIPPAAVLAILAAVVIFGTASDLWKRKRSGKD